MCIRWVPVSFFRSILTTEKKEPTRLHKNVMTLMISFDFVLHVIISTFDYLSGIGTRRWSWAK